MTDPNTLELLETAPVKHRAFVKSVVEKLESNDVLKEKVCSFLAKKIGDKELSEEFLHLSPETKLQACMEYLIIGLTSGSFEQKEVEALSKN